MEKIKKAYTLKITVFFLIGLFLFSIAASGNPDSCLRGRLLGNDAEGRERLTSGNYDLFVNSLLDREGITSNSNGYFADIWDSSIKLFRFIVDEKDPRTRIAAHYLLIPELYKGLSFENALLATYCSDYPSMRFGYSQYISLPSLIQLIRAIKNIEIGSRLPLTEEEDRGYSFKYKRTNKITMGRDANKVTGCPEAVWQLQLFKNRQYLGRIGFNFHEEFGKIVVSICNIQGAEDVKAELEKFKLLFEQHFGIELVEKLKKDLPLLFNEKEIIFRGGQSSEDTNLSAMYKMTFRRTKIPFYRTGKRMLREILNKVPVEINAGT
jgi:hypothetical protein